MLKRSRLFALIALLCAGLLAGCGSDDDSGGGSGGGSDDPAALLEKAFAKNADSGEIRVKASAEVDGAPQMKGPVSFELEGPFKSRGKNTLPLVDWDLSFQGAGQSLSGGVVATEDNAFVKFRGQTYEVGSRLYKQFLREQERQSKDGPQSFKELGVDPAKWMEDAKVSDGEPVGGDDTREVTGKVNVEAMVDDVLEAIKNPSIRKQFESGGQSIPEVSDSDRKKVVDAIDEAKFAVNVDDDDLARKVSFSVRFDVPEGVDADGVTGGRFEIEYELPKVGGDVDIEAPSDAKPLSLLLQQLGLGSNLPGGGLRTQ